MKDSGRSFRGTAGCSTGSTACSLQRRRSVTGSPVPAERMSRPMPGRRNLRSSARRVRSATDPRCHLAIRGSLSSVLSGRRGETSSGSPIRRSDTGRIAWRWPRRGTWRNSGAGLPVDGGEVLAGLRGSSGGRRRGYRGQRSRRGVRARTQPRRAAGWANARPRQQGIAGRRRRVDASYGGPLGAAILPIDSEHSGLLQLLEGRDPGDLRRGILTASGGPFRTWPLERLADATPRRR